MTPLRTILRALVILAALTPVAARPQATVLQGGPWAQGHLPMYTGQGFSQPVVMDGGGSGGGALGVNPSEIGIVARSPTNTYPSASSGNGPDAEHDCLYDAPITNATGYHYLCFDPNAGGGGLIAYGAGGVASQLPLKLLLNGIIYPFPFSAGGVLGPVSTTVGDFAIWNNTAGTLLKDSPAATGVLGFLAGTPAAGAATGFLVQENYTPPSSPSPPTAMFVNPASVPPASTDWGPNGFTYSANYMRMLVPGPHSYGTNNVLSLFMNTPGSGGTFSSGQANLDNGLSIAVEKTCYISGGAGCATNNATEGFLQATVLNVNQGVKGDASVVVGQGFKAKSGNNAIDTGGLTGAELDAGFEDTVGNVTQYVSTLISVNESFSGLTKGTGYGVYTEAWANTVWSAYHVDTFNGFAGAPSPPTAYNWTLAFDATHDRQLSGEYFAVRGNAVSGVIQPGDIIQGSPGFTLASAGAIPATTGTACKIIRTGITGLLQFRNCADTLNLMTLSDTGLFTQSVSSNIVWNTRANGTAYEVDITDGVSSQQALTFNASNIGFAIGGTTYITVINGYLGLTPSTWTDTNTCTTGQISVDTGFVYVCTATNTVKRATLASF